MSRLHKEAQQPHQYNQQQIISNEEKYRPTVVRVFGRNFSVTYSPPLYGGMDEDLGVTHANEGMVIIKDGQHPLEEKDTVLHEFLHVIDNVMGLDLDEKQVTVMAHGLIGIFQDNPEFAKYIIERIEA